MKPSELRRLLNLSDLRPPRMLTIAITGACNLKCCHCWVKAGEAASNAHVPLQTVRKLLEEFAAMDGEGARITGGEPLSHPHWLDIVHLARSLRFGRIVLQTNAMLLRDDHLAPLRELDFPGLTIQISLDGVSPQTHDLVRGKGAYSGALRGITKLVLGGLAPKISIFLTEMRHNLHEIPELLEFADRSGIGSVSTGAMVLCGRASETSLVAPPTVEQYLSLLERYEHDDHFRELYEKIGTVAALEWRKDSPSRQECCTFIENPYITPSGILYPCLMCHTDEYSVTKVFEKELGAAFAEGVPLWSSLHSMSRCRPDVIPECRDCSEKASCAGGCMGRAWGSCGNLLAVDDRCEVRRIIGKYRNKR